MIGILGGTFDPIHTGHLRMALEALEKYKLREVRFIPAKIPVHKKMPGASAKDRVNMIKLAIKSEKRFVVDDREIKRESPSYTIETLQSLSDQKLALIIGSDVLPTFTEWHRWQEILDLAKLIVLPRELPISSTQIRKLLQQGKNPRYLLPDKVLDYINTHRLYY